MDINIDNILQLNVKIHVICPIINRQLEMQC